MKKNRLYFVAIILLLVAVVAILINYIRQQKNDENKTYTILPRKGAAANTAEWIYAKRRADSLSVVIQADPSNTKSTLTLASLFIQEARVTGNYVYYDMAAMKYVNNVLKEDSTNFNALVFKSLIQLSQHHFAEGLATAYKAKAVNPYNAYVYGLLVDGNVEMGNYDSAVANADRMVSIRPDLTSYSRISYLREIFGNYKSAIEAMKMAAETGGPGDEHTEWTRVQLGGLYEKTGDYKRADTVYKISLNYRPGYAYAIAGLARVAAVSKDYNTAISYYQKADSLVDDNSIKEELADVYRLVGKNKEADETAKKVIEDLTQNAEAGNKDENIGHYADRELAYAYLKVNEKDKALEHAMLEYNRRPDNIDVNETVAWVHYNRGEYAKALPYIKTALRTNSKNPVLLSRAGLIYYKAGNKELAKSMLQQTSLSNPYISNSLRAEAMAAMQSM